VAADRDCILPDSTDIVPVHSASSAWILFGCFKIIDGSDFSFLLAD